MTPDERYHINLDKLREKNTTLAGQIDALPLHNLQLQPCPKDPNLLIGLTWDVHTQAWVPLCNDDPELEAERDADQWYTPDKMIFCLIGVGLGYFAAALGRRLQPHQRLGIFEVNPMHYKAAMHCVDFDDVLSNDNCRIDTYLGSNLKENIRYWFQTFEINSKFHIQEPLRSGYTHGYEKTFHDELGLAVYDMLRYHAVGLATWAQYGPHICDNDFGNLPEYMVTPGYQELENAWAGKPAVCIAAGPSLQKNLAQLADPSIRKHLGVLTVGTVYALVQALGIAPDIATTIDFQPLNWTDQFRHVPLDSAPALVYLHSTYPATVRRWPGPRYVALNASDTAGWMRQFTEEKKSAGMVQTVAHLNLITALEMGADPIILIGQDLSMSYDTHHAPGARVQDWAPEVHPDAHFEATDYKGDPCYTRHSMMSMKTVFEQIIAQHPGRRVINCTEGGMALHGAENRPLKDVLDEIRAADVPVDRQLVDIVRDRFKAYKPQPKWDELENGLHTLITQVETMVADAPTWLADFGKWEQAVADGGTDEADTLAKDLVERGEHINSLPHAFNLFVIRQFSLLEKLSEIPLPNGTPEPEIRVNRIGKMQAVYKAIEEEGPTVLRLLRRTQQRVQDLTVNPEEANSVDSIAGMLARESITAVSSLLANGFCTTGMQEYMRLSAQVAYHRQQYHVAMAMAPLAAGLHKRCNNRLREHQMAINEVVRPYYETANNETDWLDAWLDPCGVPMVDDTGGGDDVLDTEKQKTVTLEG